MIHLKYIEFKDLNIKINNSELISVIGPNGSGKTYLLKKICNRINDNNTYIDGKNIKEYNLEYKRKNIVCVLNDNHFNTKYVKSELEYYLNKINIYNKEKIDYFINYFNLKKIINENISSLSIENKFYIKILSLLIINPSIFCVDDLLTYLSSNKKTKILNYIKDNNITFINVTSDMEELLLCDKVLILNKGKCEIFSDNESVLKNENIFKKLGLSLPFIYDINNLLISYDLIYNYNIVKKGLVDLLWK